MFVVCIRVLVVYIRMLVVCIRMYPYVPYVTRMLLVCYPYVLVWCFSHDHAEHGFNSLRFLQISLMT